MMNGLPDITQQPGQVIPGANPLQQLQMLALQGAQRRMQNAPAPDERQKALESVMQAQRQQAPFQSGLDAMLAGFVSNLGAPESQWASNAFKMGVENKQLMNQGELNATKALYEDILKREEAANQAMGAGSMTALTSAMLNPIQNIGGVGINRLTGETVVPKDFTVEAFRYFKGREKQLQESGIPHASQQAMVETQQKFGQLLSNPSVAGSTYAQRPSMTPTPTQGGRPPVGPQVDLAPIGTPGVTRDANSWLMKLRSEESDAVRNGDYETANSILAAIKAIEDQAAKEENAPTPAQPRSKPQMARAETTEKESAKALIDYENGVVAASDSAAKQLMNLNKLEEQSKKANLGMTAKFRTDALRFADVAGVDLTKEEREAMDANQIIDKVALQLATQGAKAISSRPTQLEFEKLLSGGVPAATMSSGAFKHVLGMFRKQAEKDQGQLADFMKWKHNAPGGAQSPGDFADYWALRSDPRYYNLSMQDVLDTMKARKMSFNEVISKLRERK